MTSRYIALLAAVLAIGVLPGTAHAAPLLSAGLTLENDDVALGNGYVYWVNLKYRGKGSSRYPSSTIYQRRIADGQTRVLLKSARMAVTKLFATGDRVSFGVTRLDRALKKNRTGLYTNEIFAMAAGDLVPTMVRHGERKISASTTVRHRNGRRYTSTTYKECGDENALEALDEVGQMLITETSTSCPDGKPVSTSHIYSVGGEAGLRVTGLGNSYVTYLHFGELITTPERFVIVRDLTSGKSTRYPADLFTDQVANDAAGNLATVSTVRPPGKKSDWISAVKIFRAGETTPAALIYEPTLSIPSVVMCAGGVVEITQVKGQTQMKLALRTLDGTLVKRVDGPRGIFIYDATCEGRHLNVATQKYNEQPKTYGFDF